jgi:threonine dehydrogenase-like Zn-dependent dehydrogenase
MRALTYHGPADVRVTSKRDPEIEHSNDAILRVTRAAICGSDLHLYRGLVPDTRVGHTFGHEFTGVVEEVGSDVLSLQPGDRVVVPFNISCGTCFFCQRDLYALCENTNPASEIASGCFGYSHSTGGYDGGQAQLVRVPFADVGPMKIPDDMDDESVLFLSDIFPTGYMAAEMGEIHPGESVAVFGCGPVGLLAQKSAWLKGAGRVIGIDPSAYRVAFAERWSGVEGITLGSVPDVVATLKEMTDGRGPDVVIDAVGLEADGSVMHDFVGRVAMLQAGSPVVIGHAINAVRKGGRVVLIGVYGPPWNWVPMGTAMNKNLTLRMGQTSVKRYMPRLLEHIRDGRVEPRELITHRLPLDEAPGAYEMFARKQEDVIKVVLTP